VSLEQKIAYCKKERSRVDERLSTARFNGVFGEPRSPAGMIIVSSEEQSILNELDEAHRIIETTPFEYTECLRAISNASSLLQNVMSGLSRQKKFVVKYGGEIWLYLTSFLIVVTILHVFGYYVNLSATSGIPLVAIYAVWGVVGGILRGIWYLWVNINRGSYRVEWRIWFISCPFLGGIFGAISYLLIVSSLVIITNDEGTINTPEAIYFVAVFGGFNWNWFVSLMKSIADAIHKSDDPS
jgi:hypothetical protein